MYHIQYFRGVLCTGARAVFFAPTPITTAYTLGNCEVL